jgi:hypothetical protein
MKIFKKFISRFLVGILIVSTPVSAVSDPKTTIVYAYDHEVIVTIRSLDDIDSYFYIMLGGSTPKLDIPLLEGQYELLVGRIEDFTVSTRRVISLAGDTIQTIELEPVSFSPAYELEQARSETLRTTAIAGTIRSQQRRSRTFRNISLSSALLAGAGTGAAFYIGNNAYNAYQSATTSADASEQRAQVEMAADIALGTAVVAGAGLIAGLIAHLKTPKDGGAQDALNASIRALHDAQAGISEWPEYVSDEFVLGLEDFQ